MRKNKWTKKALQDLDSEVEYIAKDNPQAAQKVTTLIRSSVNLLETMPNMGRLGKKEGTRELIIPNLPYFVRYKVKEETNQILNVFHTSRKIEF